MGSETIRFLGHTTVLLQTGDAKLLFDPNFSATLFAARRHEAPVFDPFELQSVDAVLVGNAHFNRFDLSSYKYFKTTTKLILPHGLKALGEHQLHFDFTELKPDEAIDIKDYRITALKAMHHGRRLFGLQYANCLNYLVQTPGLTLFYGSDNQYGPAFAEIGKKFQIDVAILPIDFVGPEFISYNRYLSPERAIQAFLDLKAKIMIPNAYGSFTFGSRSPDAALMQLRKEMENRMLKDRILILRPGQSFTLQAGEFLRSAAL